MHEAILISDDDADVRSALRYLLQTEGYEVEAVASPAEALSALKKKNFSVLLADLNYSKDTTSGQEGLELISKVSELDSLCAIVAMTAWGSIETAVKAMQAGARDFVLKPWENERLLAIVANQIRLNEAERKSLRLSEENKLLRDELQPANSEIIWKSAAMQSVMSQLDQVAPSDANILFTGENGTGKELAANSVRNASKRRHKPFVKVNCAAFTESLLESELFGHERGAFTGATERRLGRFEQAHTGTLFLDEIGELSLEAQSKLLRVLQEQSFERVGGSKTIEVDVRIITATNRDLESMVQNGTFRMDLYYRLNVFPITMPPLRAHKQDIPLLCETFIKQLNKKLGKQVIAISNKSLDSLARYDWPGNIRELQNVLEREMILSTRDILSFSFKPQQNLTVDDNLKLSLTEVEKAHIIKVLNHYHWKIGGKNGAAKHLGLPDSTLRSRMDKLNIRRPAPNS